MAKVLIAAVAFAAKLKEVEALIGSLQENGVVLVKAIRTKTSKLQLEFAERLARTNVTEGFEPGINLLSMANASDPRFVNKARRAWLTGDVLELSTMFNVNLGDDAPWGTNPDTGKEELLLGILNPEIATAPGHVARVQVRESLKPTDYEAANIETTAKRRGKDGDFITHNGQYIFSRTLVTAYPKGAQVPHIKLQADSVSEEGIKVPTKKQSVVNEVGM